MNVLTTIGLNRFSLGYTAAGITLGAMGIVWKKGCRVLRLRNGSTTNITVTDGSAAPTTTSYPLLPGATPGGGNELVIHGTMQSFKSLLFNTAAGETGVLLVQQDNDMATAV